MNCINGPGLTNHTSESTIVNNGIGAIVDQQNSGLTLVSKGGTKTANGAEQNLYINNAPFGIYRPVCVMVDLDNMQAGDTTVIRVYYRILQGGGLQLQSYNSYTGADGGLANGMKLVHIDLHCSRFGIKVTLQQTAGVNTDYDWQVVEES